MRLLQTLGWLACVIYSTIPFYWMVIHPWAGYWRSRRRSPFFVLLPAWIGMWAVAGAITAPWRYAHFYSMPWAWIPGGMLFIAGFSAYIFATKGFSVRQLGGLPELMPEHEEQRLIISGIRSRVRHPVYLGHLCEMLGWSLGTGLVMCYGLTAFALVTGAVMIRMEDAELAKRFGEEYTAYRERVPAVLPGMNS